jgi:carotenoid cleavage dioxygenase
MPFKFKREAGARLGVMPRNGTNADVRWFEIEPCYVFHPLNAYEDAAGRIVIDVARYPQMWREGGTFADTACLWRWVIDLASGTVVETQLDDRRCEFPRVADDRIGLAHRYGYLASEHALLKYDLGDGAAGTAHEFGPDRTPGEAVFVPADGATEEDEGYLLTYVHDAVEDRSDFVVLDARDIAAEPIATVRLPRRVPVGFHGSWIADPA